MNVRRFALLFFLMIAPLGAQETLDLAAAWTRGQSANLELAQEEQAVRQAELDVRIQRADYLPVLGLSGSYRYVSELARLELPFSLPDGSSPEIEAGVQNQYDAALTLSQPLFTGFRTRNRVRASEAAYQSRQSGRQVTRNRLLLEIGILYFDMHLNRLQDAALRQGAERVRLQMERARNRLANGQATPFDTLEAATRLTQYRLQRQVLENEFTVLESAFGFLLNSDGPVTIDRDARTLPLADSGDLSAQLEIAARLRPELHQLSSLRTALDFNRKALRSAYFPQVSAQASYHYGRPGVNMFRDEWIAEGGDMDSGSDED